MRDLSKSFTLNGRRLEVLRGIDLTVRQGDCWVVHGGNGAGDIPVAYTALRLGKGGPVLAVGRDLRAIAAIQQRFQRTGNCKALAQAGTWSYGHKLPLKSRWLGCRSSRTPGAPQDQSREPWWC